MSLHTSSGLLILLSIFNQLLGVKTSLAEFYKDDLYAGNASLLVNRPKRQPSNELLVKNFIQNFRRGNKLFDTMQKEFHEVMKEKYKKKKFKNARRGSFSKILAKFNEPSYCSKKYWPEHEELLQASRMLMNSMPSVLFTRQELETLGVRMMPHKPTYLQENGRCKYYYNCDSKKGLKYRTLDGTCNNLNMPEFGAKDAPLKSHLKPAYDDNLDKPRMFSEFNDGFSTRYPLPGPREVSLSAADGINTLDPGCSLLFMQWAQFMDHDLSITVLTGEETGTVPDCMGCDSHDTVSDECWPFKVPPDDPFFPQLDSEGKQKCFDFTRSAGARDSNLREQVNGITAYIDASNVYGSDDERASDLRTFQNGKMKMSLNNYGEPICPTDPTNENCRIPEPNKYCFIAGDARVNEQLALTAIHSVFLNIHDKVSSALGAINPQWGDNTIYQETRKIVGAISQRITYAEFLPIVVGPIWMDSSGLRLQEEGFAQVYNDQCDATIENSFATAAYRFGHSSLPDILPALLMEENGATLATPKLVDIPLVKTFMNPHEMYQQGFSNYLLLGMSNKSAGTVDSSFATSVQDQLFEQPGKPKTGSDLVALNIQRGRDHGLPGYTKFRQWCDDRRIETFEDLQGLMKPAKIAKLKTVYRAVQDIDLFIGGMTEIPAPGAVVGPTFQCIIADQFERLKKCDRFWHELKGQFSDTQLAEIRKTSLAWALCHSRFNQNLDIPMRTLPMMMKSQWTTCSQIPGPNFDAWKQQ